MTPMAVALSAPIKMLSGAGTDGAMPTMDLPANTMLEMKKPT